MTLLLILYEASTEGVQGDEAARNQTSSLRPINTGASYESLYLIRPERGLLPKNVLGSREPFMAPRRLN